MYFSLCLKVKQPKYLASHTALQEATGSNKAKIKDN